MKVPKLPLSPTRSLMRGVIALAILAAAQAALALEFGLDTDTTNINIPWSRLTPMTVDKLPRDYYFWGCDAWASTPLGEDASIRFAYVRDIVLRNTMMTTVQFERGIAKVAVGPLFGFLNSESCPFSAGMTASVRLQWPGVAYVAVRSDGGTAIMSFQDKAEPQALTELSAGFYVPYAIVSGVVTVKRFNELDDDELVSDSLTRYAMTIEVFKKNVPYTTLFSMGYEQRSKHYDAYSETDSLGSIFLGLDASMQIQKGLTFKGGFSAAAYVFGLDALRSRGPGSSAFMFGFNFGIVVDTSQIQASPKPDAASGAESGESDAPADAAQNEAAEAKSDDSAAKPAESPAEASPEAKSETTEEAKPESSEAEPEKEKPEFSRLAFDVGGGYYYGDRLKLDGALGIIATIFNSRIGGCVYIGYRITPRIAAGAEATLDYLTFSGSGADLTLYDLPLRANFRYSLGKVDLEGFTGAFINGITSGGSSSTAYYTDYDFGLRARFGGLFAELSYVIGIASKDISVEGVGSVAKNYPRFGLGYAFRVK